MKAAISKQSIEMKIERQKAIINRLVTAALVCGAILVVALVLIPFCEVLSKIKPSGVGQWFEPSGVGQWLRVKRLSFFVGTAFLFSFYCPVTASAVLFAAGVEILRIWGSYSVTTVLFQGFCSVIIVLMNQLQMAALAGTPIGSS